MSRNHAKEFEGRDIMYYLNLNIDDIEDDELTVGRIRSIYVQANYGNKSRMEIAKYYNIPVDVVKGIATGKLFKSITKDIEN